MTSEMNRTLGVEEKSVNNCECSRKWQVNGSRTARIWQVVAPLLFVAFGLFGVNESAWGAIWDKTYTIKVGVGEGKGKAMVELYKSPITGDSKVKNTDWVTQGQNPTSTSGNIYYSTDAYAKFIAEPATGYTFASWHEKDATCKNSASSTSATYSTGKQRNVNYTFEYYAKFTPNEYKITLDKQNGSGGDAEIIATYETNTNLTSGVSTPSRTGYVFKGYFTQTNGGGTQLIDANGNVLAGKSGYTDSNKKWIKADKVTLYASWKAKYTITFNAHGGSAVSSKEVVSGEQYGTLPTTTRSGYTFAGWYTAETGGTQVTSTTTVNINANQTLHAHWLAHYSVAFNANGGSGSMSAQAFVEGTEQALTANAFTRTGYTFAGWATSDNGNVAYTNGQIVNNLSSTGNATVPLYAKWTANTYYVSFNGNGSTSGSMSNQTFKYDEAAKSLSSNTYVKSYTVTFNGNSGTPASSSLTATAPFLGWATSANGDKVYNDQQSVSNLTSANGTTVPLYAKWGTGSITLPTATRSGFHLDGWYNGDVDIPANKVGDAGQSYTPTSNVTLVARWSQSQLTTSFSGSNQNMNVGDEQNPAFVISNAPNVQVHISVTSIDDVTDGSGTVIEYNAANNTVTARNAGVATIFFTQDETEEVSGGTSDKWTYTVTKKDPSFDGSAYNGLMVDDVQEADYTYSNTSALIPSASTDSNFYYTIDNISYTNQLKNKKYNSLDSLVRFVPGTKAIVALNAGTGKITLHQKETYKYNAGSASFNVTVSKYTPSFSGSHYTGLKVEDVQTVNYSYSNTSAAKPTASSSDAFYYRVDVTKFDSLELNKGGEVLVTYDPNSNTLTANNAGTGKVVLRQEETYKYKADSLVSDVTVGKHTNTVYVKGSTTYSASIGLTDVVTGVTLTATNTDYLNSPFVVTQTSGKDAAAFDKEAQTISALGTPNTANWSVTQPENYKYLEGTGSFSVTVSKAEEEICYVLNIADQQTSTQTYSMSGPGNKLYLDFRRSWGDTSSKIKIYGIKSDNSQTQIDKPDWDDNWTRNKEYNILNQGYTKIKIELSGGVNAKYFENVKVTRQTYLTTSDITITKQADGNTPVYPSTEGKGSLSVSYSISNGGSLMLSCDNNKFKFTNSKNSATGTPISLNTSDCESDALNIPVYFSATKEGTETANVVIYNNVFRATATITATTIKRTPSVTAPTAKDLTYNGDAQALVNPATTDGGELQYRLGDGEWNTAVPTATNAGDYTVYYKVVGNDNYYDVAAKSVSASIKKANAVLNSAPTAVANLVYTGSAQSLVNAGTATNGTLQYALGNEDYSTSIPTATNADTYTVYYKVVGNANYNDVAASSVEVTITRAASSLTKAPTAVANLVYTGTEQTLVNNDGTANGGTIQYSLNNENYSADLPTATNAGAHTVYYKVVGDENHNNTDAANFSVTIGTKALTITADNKGVTYGDDAPANSVQYAGFVNSETSAVLGGTLDYDCSYAAGSAVGTYDIMPKGLTSSNYAITFSKGTLTVGKKTLTVTADDKNISYGAAAPTYTASYSGFAGEETASVLGGTLAFACTYKAGDDATDYTITPSGLTSGNYAFNYVAGTLHVGKAAATVTAPTAKELTYNGSAQALINAGSTEHGDILYKLGSGDWSADVPTATNAGNYTVSYKVVADANHNDVAETAVANVAIAKATPEVTAPTAINPEYTGLAQNLVNAGSTTGGTLQYSLLPSAAYSPSIPQAAFIGTYIVYYRVVGNDNYNNVDPAYISATIARPAISIVNSSSWDDVSDSTSVRIPGSTNIVIDEAVSLYSLTIEAGSKLTIAPTGSLRLGKGGITGAAKDSLVLQAVTDATKASSETLGQTSALIFSPDYEGEMPVAKVEMYSVGYKDLSGATDRDEWQYVGIPIAKADYAAKDAFPKSWVYSWNEATDSWVNNRSTLKLQPFVGVATTQYRDANGYKMTFEGQLADNRGIKEVPLTHAGEGWNLIANSFAGPIDVTKLTVEDFGGAEATIHIWDTKEDQYIELPVGSIKGLDDRQHVIPSMQAFFVQTTAATTLTLDYNRLVWGGEESNVPLKAKRNGQSESSLNGKMSISLTDGVSTDNLYLLESQNYATAYENGYDAPKKFSEANVNAIYAIEDERALSVDATNSIAGTRLGLRTTGSGSYLMMFTRVEGSDDWYLLDKQTGAQMLIQEGADYEFEVESGAPVDDRFEIVGPAAAPGVATDVENSDVAEKAVKYLDNNILIIQRKGTKYNSLGQKIQ